jgi:lipid-A-disaccharide synthase-like uncharacterized protein
MKFVEQYWVYGLGFFAQSLFGCRQLVQLFYSERQGRVVSPTLFWQLSLLGSFLFLIYGIIRDDAVIILGQTLSYFIYIRNLQLKDSWKVMPVVLRFLLIMLPIFTLVWVLVVSEEAMTNLLTKTDFTHPLLILGAIGQLLLNLRFVYQWYYSEKYKQSILPLGFWIISLVASVMIILYAAYRTPIDPVLLVAQSMGIFVYVRNIILHGRAKARAHVTP